MQTKSGESNVTGKVGIMMMAVAVFAMLWPSAACKLLDSLPGYKLSYRDMDAGFTCCAMFLVGVPLATHVGMLAVQRTIWLASQTARQTFFCLSTISAVFITCVDYGMKCKFGGDARYNAAYLLSVQGIPILWFLYNANGEAIKAMWTLRRRGTS